MVRVEANPEPPDFSHGEAQFALMHSSGGGTCLRTQFRCEECHDAMNIGVFHFSISLDMTGTWNQPGLYMSIWCRRGCRREFGHIRRKDDVIVGALDEEKRTGSYFRHHIYRSYRIVVNAIEHLRGYSCSGDE